MTALLLPARPLIPERLEMPAIAYAQDGLFTRAQARQAGWSDGRQQRLLRAALWRTVSGSVLRHTAVDLGPWQAARAVHLTSGLVVSHATAAALWGLSCLLSLHGIGHVRFARRSVAVHRLRISDDDIVLGGGLRLTSAIRTLTDLLCWQSIEDSVATVTEGMRQGLVSAADLRLAASRAHGRTGVDRVRQLAHSCRHEPHSVLEWRFHSIVDGIPGRWSFHPEIRDDHGLVGYVDAVHEDSRVVVEVDGLGFHGPDRFQADRTRDQRLAALGYVVIRFTWRDVNERPMEVAETIRRTIWTRMR